MASSRFRLRGIVVSGCFLLGFAIVLLRLVDLQILQAAELSARAEGQHQRFATITGLRGSMYDRNGKVLAMNVDVPSVYGDPSLIQRPSVVARDLAPLLRVRPGVLERKLKREGRFVWLARKIDVEDGRRVESITHKGIGVILEGRRYYPKGSLLGHVIGFAGIDNQGLEGLEKTYDSTLRGKQYQVLLQRDARRHIVYRKGPLPEESAAGHNITLTIDEFVQYAIEAALAKAVLASRAKGGMVIVMEPDTGAILGMAVNPSFDPNGRRERDSSKWKNKVVTDSYEPGSTLKIFLAASALEGHVMNPDSLVYGEQGRLREAGTIIHDHEPLGWMTFATMIEQSSNIGAVKTAKRVGGDQYYDTLRAFGFGSRTGIDFPGESPGRVKHPNSWERRTLASMAFGQEISVTPLQLVTAVSAIANGGCLMKPYLVSTIHDALGHVVYQAKPTVRRCPVSTATVETLSGILENTVARGTGTRAAVPGYRVAGKTGTSQIYDPEHEAYSKTKLVASFVGYAPSDNPRVTILVVIEEPQKYSWGGVIAAPVFRKIGQQILPYLGVVS